MPPSEKATRIRQRGTTEHRDEANRLLDEPGDTVLVERGVPRSLVMRCPDGCGETLTINLDRRAGKAWRLRAEKNATWSLYPSVWKVDGCRSHFIVRQSRIIWCESEHQTLDRSRGPRQVVPQPLAPVESNSLPKKEQQHSEVNSAGAHRSCTRSLSTLWSALRGSFR